MQRTTLRFRGCHRLTVASLQVRLLLPFLPWTLGSPHEIRSKPQERFQVETPLPQIRRGFSRVNDGRRLLSVFEMLYRQCVLKEELGEAMSVLPLLQKLVVEEREFLRAA